MIAEAFLLSIIIAMIRGGSFKSLGRIPIRHVSLFVLPFVISGAMCYVQVRTGSQALLPFTRAINVGLYVCLLTAMYLNRHIREMILPAIGTFLNALVIAANGGAMPVSTDTLKMVGMGDLISSGFHWGIRHIQMGSETRLRWLGDLIPAGARGIPFSEVGSIGDILLAVGVFILVQRYMFRPTEEAKECLASG